jgi:hypothetical protein
VGRNADDGDIGPTAAASTADEDGDAVNADIRVRVQSA